MNLPLNTAFIISISGDYILLSQVIYSPYIMVIIYLLYIDTNKRIKAVIEGGQF